MADKGQRRINVFLDASIKGFHSGFKKAEKTVKMFGAHINSQSSRIRRTMRSWGTSAAWMGDKFKRAFRKIESGIRRTLSMFRGFGSKLKTMVVSPIMAIATTLATLGASVGIADAVEYDRQIKKLRTVTGLSRSMLAAVNRDVEKVAEQTKISKQSLMEGVTHFWDTRGRIPTFEEIYQMGYKSKALMTEPKYIVGQQETARLGSGMLAYRYPVGELADILQNSLRGSILYNPEVLTQQRGNVTSALLGLNVKEPFDLAIAGSFLKYMSKGEESAAGALNKVEALIRRFEFWDKGQFDTIMLIDKLLEAVGRLQAGKGRIIDKHGHDITRRVISPEYLRPLQTMAAQLDAEGLSVADFRKQLIAEANEVLMQGDKIDQANFNKNLEDIDSGLDDLKNKFLHFVSKSIPDLTEILQKLNSVLTGERLDKIGRVFEALLAATQPLRDALWFLAEQVGRLIDLIPAGEDSERAESEVKRTEKAREDMSLWFYRHLGKKELSDADKKRLNSMLDSRIRPEHLEIFKRVHPGVKAEMGSLADTLTREQIKQLLEIYYGEWGKQGAKAEIDKLASDPVQETLARFASGGYLLPEKSSNRALLEKLDKTLTELTPAKSRVGDERRVMFNLDINPNTGEMDISQPYGSIPVRSTFTRPTGNLRI